MVTQCIIITIKYIEYPNNNIHAEFNYHKKVRAQLNKKKIVIRSIWLHISIHYIINLRINLLSSLKLLINIKV